VEGDRSRIVLDCIVRPWPLKGNMSIEDDRGSKLSDDIGGGGQMEGGVHAPF
jgi:hypothetical protein